MRTIISKPPFLASPDPNVAPWSGRGMWPCKWVVNRETAVPQVVAFRKRFTLGGDATVRVHVSADERYELFLDGRRIGRGPERGDVNNWFFETYDLDIPKGEHVVVARVWSLGERAPFAQMTLRPGFLFAPEGEFTAILGTGVAEWEAKRLGGYEFVTQGPAWGTGNKVSIDAAAYPWGFERGEGDGWEPAVAGPAARDADFRNETQPVHLMRPATLPPMMEEERTVGRVRHIAAAASADLDTVAVRAADHLAAEAGLWARLVRGQPLTVPPNTRRRIIVDLDDYYCAYPELVTSGGQGSTIRILWAEALYLDPKKPEKGNRNEIEGKFLRGTGDTFRPDGGSGRTFSTLWWEAGRYLEFYVETAAAPLVVCRFSLRETRYPLRMEAQFKSSDPRIDATIPIAFRTLQMCSHETYMDCPYYEQLMYVGDTRLEVLTTYCTARDDRLPRKALRAFDFSRLTSGLTQSRYPSRVLQVIPPFSLWWVGMLYDFSLWRDDPALVRRLMPGARGILDAYLRFLNKDGLVEGPHGWNYMDWVPEWRWGVPPDADRGVNASINWQFILILAIAAELEESLGEKELAARDRRLAAQLAKRATAAFWDERRGLLADDLRKKHFSEHVQCLAILSGLLPAARRTRIFRGLLEAADLARTTIYFSHYLFETMRLMGRMDVVFERLGLWLTLKDLGFKTTLEHPEPSRSDCHAWAAHPIYHYFASVLGIRPASPGFRTVTIAPQLGPLAEARGRLVHPKGFIEVDLAVKGGRLGGKVRLPKGVTGTYVAGGKRRRLRAGVQVV